MCVRLANKHNINAQDNELWTPLHLARERYADICTYLFNKGVTLEKKCTTKKTALVVALEAAFRHVGYTSYHTRRQTLHVLLARGANTGSWDA
jgi:hypothetical protein